MIFREIIIVKFVFLIIKSAISVTNLHNIICYYATIYLVEHNKPLFNHIFILNDDVTPEMWKSVSAVLYLHNTT